MRPWFPARRLLHLLWLLPFECLAKQKSTSADLIYCITVCAERRRATKACIGLTPCRAVPCPTCTHGLQPTNRSVIRFTLCLTEQGCTPTAHPAAGGAHDPFYSCQEVRGLASGKGSKTVRVVLFSVAFSFFLFLFFVFLFGRIQLTIRSQLSPLTCLQNVDTPASALSERTQHNAHRHTSTATEDQTRNRLHPSSQAVPLTNVQSYLCLFPSLARLFRLRRCCLLRRTLLLSIPFELQSIVKA